MTSTESTPLASVIIPTYNRCALLREAIDSVLAQTFRDYELIVVDDGSTDGTGQALAAYGNQIRYVYQENAGESVARQHGVEISRGQLLAFLDSDDLWLPAKLEKQVALLSANPRLGFVYCWTWIIDRDGKRLEIPPLGYGQSPADLSLERLIKGNFIVGPGSTLLVRREPFEASGGFDPAIRYAEDWDLALRLAAESPFGCLPEPLVEYRLQQRGWLQARENIDPMQADHSRILDKLFSQPRVAACALAQVEPAARANRHAFAAFQHYVYGNTVRGKEELGRACGLAPATWADPLTFLQALAEYSMLLVDLGTEKDALSFGEMVASHLPSGLVQPEITRARIFGWIHMTLAHRSGRIADWGSMRSHIIRAMRFDLAWLANRGALSWLVKSTLPLGRPGQPAWCGSSNHWGAPWLLDITL